MQKQKDNKFHPMFYYSKRATETESRYHSYELETLAIIYALRRFRVYLMGITFKIVTDCQSLTLTLNKKFINPRISRWALELQSFDYRVEHRKGEKMQHANALSRSINILQVSDESFEFILAAAQRQDPKIVTIASELEKSESSSYEMVDGLIYRKIKDKILFYVPQHMETQVIRTNHEAMSHLGVDKCFDFLARSYWFPAMKEKIRTYIKTCLKCIYYSPDSGKVEGTLHSIPKSKIPFDTLHVDHLGPLTTSGPKKHIFLVIDGFTKYVKLYPVKTTQTKEAIVCLKFFFENYSRPNRIISDRGTCFTSAEFNNFMVDNNIQYIKVATHSPQSNGQIERIDRVIIPMLSKECEADTTMGWDKYLVKIEFSLNNTLNRSTGFTPSMLLFGRNQKGEVNDRLKEYLEEKIGENLINRDDIRNQALQNIGKNQEYNKSCFGRLYLFMRLRKKM